RPLRIVRPVFKLIYVVVLVVGFGVLRLAFVQNAIVLPPDAVQAILALLETAYFALILLACRTFRAAAEDVAPPRPWWRMTYRASLSWLLGILFVAEVAVAGWGFGAGLDDPGNAVDFVLGGIVAVLYLHSGFQLSRYNRRVRMAATASAMSGSASVP